MRAQIQRIRHDQLEEGLNWQFWVNRFSLNIPVYINQSALILDELCRLRKHNVQWGITWDFAVYTGCILRWTMHLHFLQLHKKQSQKYLGYKQSHVALGASFGAGVIHLPNTVTCRTQLSIRKNEIKWNEKKKRNLNLCICVFFCYFFLVVLNSYPSLTSVYSQTLTFTPYSALLLGFIRVQVHSGNMWAVIKRELTYKH